MLTNSWSSGTHASCMIPTIQWWYTTLSNHPLMIKALLKSGDISLWYLVVTPSKPNEYNNIYHWCWLKPRYWGIRRKVDGKLQANKKQNQHERGPHQQPWSSNEQLEQFLNSKPIINAIVRYLPAAWKSVNHPAKVANRKVDPSSLANPFWESCNHPGITSGGWFTYPWAKKTLVFWPTVLMWLSFYWLVSVV